MDKSRIELMEKRPVKSAILQLALPTMLAMAVQLIYNMTDTFFIGQTGELNLVAAISLATPIFFGLQAIGNIFAIGTSSYVSRRLGAKDYIEAKHSSSVALYSAIVVGLLVTVLYFVFKDGLLNVIGTDINTLAHTEDYLTIIAIFAMIPVFQLAAAGLIRSEGATKKAMIGIIIGVAINIVLDPIFILVLDMGVSGAAWATIIGNTIGAIYFVNHLLSKKTVLSFKIKDFKPSKKIYKETFKIGMPSALSNLVMSVSFVLVNTLAVGYGTYVIAGYGIQFRLAGMVYMLVIGLAQGYQPFAGYNYGAKQYDRLKQGFKITLLYSTILAVIFMFIFIFFGENLIRIFIDDALTVAAGTQVLRAFTWAVPFIGLQMTLVVTFQSTGKAVKSLIVSLGRQCIIYIPLLYILNAQFGFEGLIYAQPVADILTTIVAVLMSFSFIKEMNLMHDNESKIVNKIA